MDDNPLILEVAGIGAGLVKAFGLLAFTGDLLRTGDLLGTSTMTMTFSPVKAGS
ncbi:MAG: hypothetical protein LC739_12355 [Actinobacteria bacterium]|nr:hypothetical protein [Actinomycetota bacterium]